MSNFFDSMELDDAKRELARARRRIAELQAQWERERQRADEAERAMAVATSIKESAPAVPKRSKVLPKPGKRRKGTAVLCCSDWHCEAIVEPKQVNGRNAHDPDIHRKRIDRLITGWTWYVQGLSQFMDVEELVVWLGGDMIENSGMPHADSAEGCAMPPGQAILLAMESWERVIMRSLELGRPVRVICNDGNHGRFGEHRRHQNRTSHSIEALGYRMSAERLRDASWAIADGVTVLSDLAGHVVRFQHGDSGGLRYQGGVGGLDVPYRRAYPRWDTLGAADVDVMGHWHTAQVMAGRGVVNGSLVGYSTFAMSIGAPYEPPRQMAFFVDEEHGLRFGTPLDAREA